MQVAFLDFIIKSIFEKCIRKCGQIHVKSDAIPFVVHSRTMVLSIVVILSLLSQTRAQLRTASLFTDGMVLQRQITVPVWGWATPGHTVSISIQEITRTTVAAEAGTWQIELPPLPASGPYTMTISSGDQTLSRAPVYVGDVWLAAGQSNMEFTVNQTDSSAQVIAAANDQLIRQFKVPKSSAAEPENELSAGGWTAATPEYVGDFSAVAYFFAAQLRRYINVPVGILNITYGGSRIEAWMSKEMLGFDENDTTLAAGETERQPTLLYNKMIHPLYRYAIKGFLWYQGESNADNMKDAMAYGSNFKNLISSWRTLWGLGDIPFLWVQLPNFGTVQDEPSTWDAWPVLRAAQSAALNLPNTGEAVTIDVGETDIHPSYKQPVGYRLALIARKVAYDEDIIYSGPRYARSTLHKNGRIAIHFSHAEGGLTARDSLAGRAGAFAVAGEDERLTWAQAVADHDSVLVWNDSVPEPLIVRYAWEYNPLHANLYNAAGNLPASPFKVYLNPGFKIAFLHSSRMLVEKGQTVELSWLVFGASTVTLDGIPVDTSGTKTATPMRNETYTLIAASRASATVRDTAMVSVVVLDPNQVNRALQGRVTASTFEACCGKELKPGFATDGDLHTRWGSAWKKDVPADTNLDDNPGDEWIAVEFEEIIDIQAVTLHWEAAYAPQYDLDVSYDGYLWNTVHSERAGNGGEDNILFKRKPAGRYIRLHGLQRGTPYGFSLYELAVYGIPSKNIRQR
jgi:sialate O-acetylesterase